MKFLVTVRIAKRKDHDPKNKVIGMCPVNKINECTDSTGEHHTFLYAPSGSMEIDDVWRYWAAYYHVTRVESAGF